MGNASLFVHYNFILSLLSLQVDANRSEEEVFNDVEKILEL